MQTQCFVFILTDYQMEINVPSVQQNGDIGVQVNLKSTNKITTIELDIFMHNVHISLRKLYAYKGQHFHGYVLFKYMTKIKMLKRCFIEQLKITSLILLV